MNLSAATNARTYSTSSGSCTTATITNWASQISAYIKSIDSNHLVAIGDEGFFNQPGNSNYVYSCAFIAAHFGVFVQRGAGAARELILPPTLPSPRSTLALSTCARYSYSCSRATDLGRAAALPRFMGRVQPNHLWHAVDHGPRDGDEDRKQARHYGGVRRDE
jgi:hypothetical protein